MARKLLRRSGGPASPHSKLVTKYVAPPESLFENVQERTVPSAITRRKTPKKQLKNKRILQPVRPKRPVSRYTLFCLEQHDALKDQLVGKPTAVYDEVMKTKWQQLSLGQKQAYTDKFMAARMEYEEQMEKYNIVLERFFQQNPLLKPEADEDGQDLSTVLNKVVRLKAGAGGKSAAPFEYFYVLTYIPDLHWCHLAPMRSVGTWGPERPRANNRPVWMLVGEEEGKELDISASFCIPVGSKAMLKTVDADVEKWDIFESDGVESTNGGSSSSPASSPAKASTNKTLNGAGTKAGKNSGSGAGVAVASAGGRSRINAKRKPYAATKPLGGKIKKRRKRTLDEESFEVRGTGVKNDRDRHDGDDDDDNSDDEVSESDSDTESSEDDADNNSNKDSDWEGNDGDDSDATIDLDEVDDETYTPKGQKKGKKRRGRPPKKQLRKDTKSGSVASNARRHGRPSPRRIPASPPKLPNRKSNRPLPSSAPTFSMVEKTPGTSKTVAANPLVQEHRQRNLASK